MSEKIAVMTTPKRMCIGGHMVTVYLTDYDLSNDTYFGESHRNRSMNTGEKCPVVEQVTGARPYPYAERPDYAFQWVEMGADEQPLIDIAQGNAESHLDDIAKGKDDRIEQVNEAHDEAAELDPADKNADGYVSRKEAKKYAREHPDE